MNPVRRYDPSKGFDWEDVAELAYKPEGSHFQHISRRVLFGEHAGLACELRYFEIQRDGHSTLERHDHRHAVLVLRGRGRVLVGDQVHALEAFDLVHVPQLTWHQFRATEGEALGFLCMVDVARDRPERPDADALRALCADTTVSDFIRT